MRPSYLLTIPYLFFNALFYIIPIGIIIFYSFLEKGEYGGVQYVFSTQAYRDSASVNYLFILAKTFALSFIVTIIAILVSVPSVYYIVRSRFSHFLLVVILLPFWVNLVLRIFSIMALMGTNGTINTMFLQWGFISEPASFLYNDSAVVLVTAYTFIPYALLPIYSSLEKFDFQLLHAARDAGAGHMRSLLTIMIPCISSGIFISFLFTFIPVMGSYAVAQLVGGKDSLYIGNLIGQQVTVLRNWPLASALAIQLLLLTLFCILLMKKFARNRTRGVC